MITLPIKEYTIILGKDLKKLVLLYKNGIEKLFFLLQKSKDLMHRGPYGKFSWQL